MKTNYEILNEQEENLKESLIEGLLAKKFESLEKVKGGVGCKFIGCGPGYCHSCPPNCLSYCTAL